MLLSGTHNVFYGEVEAVTGTPDAPRYTVVSITPGMSYRQSNLAPRGQDTGAEIIAAEVGDLCLIYDRNGDIRLYLWEGTPFDPCEEGVQGGQGGGGIGGLFSSAIGGIAGMLGLGTGTGTGAPSISGSGVGGGGSATSGGAP